MDFGCRRVLGPSGAGDPHREYCPPRPIRNYPSRCPRPSRRKVARGVEQRRTARRLPRSGDEPALGGEECRRQARGAAAIGPLREPSLQTLCTSRLRSAFRLLGVRASTSSADSVNSGRGLCSARVPLWAFSREFDLERDRAGSRGIRTNIVHPGFIETPMTAAARPATRSAQLELTPLERTGEPGRSRPYRGLSHL